MLRILGCIGALLATPAAVISAQNASPSASADAGYDFKGARLGMTFDEWKAVSPPINLRESNLGVDEKAPPLRIWCSDTRYELIKGHTIPAVRLTADEERAGVTTCAYGRIIRFMGRPQFSAAFVELGDGLSNHVIYKFRESRLYEIEIEALIKVYPGILEGLTAKFGAPTEDKRDTVTNGYGSDFPRTSKTWARGDSAIHLEAPYKKIDQMKVAFFTPSAWRQILDVQPKGPPSASKM